MQLQEETYQRQAKDTLYLQRSFIHHPPKGEQVKRYETLRNQAKALAELIIDEVPDSRERALALTNLEQASFWANAGIARNE